VASWARPFRCESRRAWCREDARAECLDLHKVVWVKPQKFADSAAQSSGNLRRRRSASASSAACTTDPVCVRDYLGHPKLRTTDRYVGLTHRPESFDRLNRALASAARNDQVVAPLSY
jgi:hypothetical protein